MLVSQTAEYALRAMAALASIEPGVPVRAADLSEATGIPAHYLSKVLRRLVLAGLLSSQKGQGGGFALAKSAEAVTFMQILMAVDAYPDEGHCAFGWGLCDEANPCALHFAWTRLSDGIRDWADGTTLAEVAEQARMDPRVQIPVPSK